jgi:hypothetical protein
MAKPREYSDGNSSWVPLARLAHFPKYCYLHRVDNITSAKDVHTFFLEANGWPFGNHSINKRTNWSEENNHSLRELVVESEQPLFKKTPLKSHPHPPRSHLLSRLRTSLYSGGNLNSNWAAIQIQTRILQLGFDLAVCGAQRTQSFQTFRTIYLGAANGKRTFY